MMRSVAELLEREGTTVDLEGGHYERLLRRRDRKRRNQRIGAWALAIILALVSLVALTRAFSTAERPADEPLPPTFTGMVIRYTGEPWSRGDLVAVDPDTGEVRTLVAADALGPERWSIDSAAWSADRRWVAFEISGCDDGSNYRGQSAGIWVTSGLDEPRQVTTRLCSEDPKVYPLDERWEWSPAGAELAVALRSIDGDALFLIDPATGDRTDLGEPSGDVTSLAWSPDGTRIAYGAVPTGTRDPYRQASQGALYSVGVGGGGGDHSLLASSLGLVSGGETGAGIRWSPDGSRIAVLTEAERTRLYLMNADGSDLDLLTKGVVIEHILGSPGLEWSPDGTRIAYATFTGEREELQIWSGSPDGSTPVLVFGSAPAPGTRIGLSGGPVWSPDGTGIAFRYSPTYEEKVWLVANADGTGHVREIDELRPLSWRGGWYFCECYG